jgi:hypothetical protein
VINDELHDLFEVVEFVVGLSPVGTGSITRWP